MESGVKKSSTNSKLLKDLDDLDDTLKPLFNKFKTQFNQYVMAVLRDQRSKQSIMDCHALRLAERNRKLTTDNYSDVGIEEAIESFYQMIMIAFLTGITDSQYRKEQLKKGHKKDFADDEQFEFDFTPNEAIEHLRQRTAIKRSDFDLLDRQAKFKSFTAVKLASVQAMDKMKDRLTKNLKEGESLGDFIKSVKSEVWSVESGGNGTLPNNSTLNTPNSKLQAESLLDPNYLEVVYRNNIGSAYNAGKMEAAKNDEDLYALEFVAITDDRTTDICDKLNGVVKPVNDEFWKEWTPPLHHNCRSTFIERYDFESNKPPITDDKYLEKLPKRNDFSGSASWFSLPDKYLKQLSEIDRETANFILLDDDKKAKAITREFRKLDKIDLHFDLKNVEIKVKEIRDAQGQKANASYERIEKKGIISFDKDTAPDFYRTIRKINKKQDLNESDVIAFSYFGHEGTHRDHKRMIITKNQDNLFEKAYECFVEKIGRTRTVDYLCDIYGEDKRVDFTKWVNNSNAYKKRVDKLNKFFEKNNIDGDKVTNTVNEKLKIFNTNTTISQLKTVLESQKYGKFEDEDLKRLFD